MVRRIVDWQKQGQNRHPSTGSKSLTKSSSFSSARFLIRLFALFLAIYSDFLLFRSRNIRSAFGFMRVRVRSLQRAQRFIDLDRLIVMNAIVARNIEQYAHSSKEDHHRGTARADERKRLSVVGRSPVQTPILTRLQAENDRDTAGQHATEPVAAQKRDANPAVNDEAESKEHKQRADQAEFFATIAKIKSDSPYVMYSSFWRLLLRPTPNSPPEPSA